MTFKEAGVITFEIKLLLHSYPELVMPQFFGDR
jgi:hypothetical protein